jgi:hypothetical protein
MTLISTTDERWSQGERIDFFLQDVCAIDPDTGAELYASYGRRKSGRGTRYTCTFPTGETRQVGGRRVVVAVKRKAFTVTAQSDRLAIEQANKALARFLSKNPVWSVDDWNWVFQKKVTA